MKLRRSTWIALSSLCLATACTGRPATGGGTEGESEDGDSTSGGNTNPNPTQPNPTTMGATDTGDSADTTEGVTTNPPETTDTPDTTTDNPPGDGCCEVHDTPGCPEPDVVDCVCAAEAACCAFEWDQNCVDLAMGKCMATCEDPGGTDDAGTTTTGVGGGDCTEVVTFEMQPSDATHSGGWSLGMSMVGEGEISVYDQMIGGGSVLFEPDIPCDDTWYIWVRYWEQGQDDSYFATLDGMPMPEAIFEGDCTGAQVGTPYGWAALNWRDQMDGPCTYVEDPWAPAWTAGVHQIEFTFRESLAMGRILITNDDALVPPP